MKLNIKKLFSQRIAFVGNFKIEKGKLLAYFSLALTFGIIFINFYRIIPRIIQSFSGFNKELVFASNKDKLSRKIGPKVIDYYEFVRQNTPENSVVLIPPQGMPWPMTGNAAYSRYFLYPRHLISGKEEEPGIDLKGSNVTYILIAWGEVNNFQFGLTHGWPKFFVPAKRIIYKKTMNENKNYESIILNKDYNPEEMKIDEWGLIEIDRERL
jgi:hypothetical protein